MLRHPPGDKPPERRWAVQRYTGTKQQWPCRTQSSTCAQGLATPSFIFIINNRVSDFRICIFTVGFCVNVSKFTFKSSYIHIHVTKFYKSTDNFKLTIVLKNFCFLIQVTTRQWVQVSYEWQICLIQVTTRQLVQVSYEWPICLIQVTTRQWVQVSYEWPICLIQVTTRQWVQVSYKWPICLIQVTMRQWVQVSYEWQICLIHRM